MLKFKYSMAEHNEIGKIGENVAVKYLISKNYTILTRNFHVKRGEIDIIASDNGFNFKKKVGNLVFVEVKTKKVNNFVNINDIYFSPENNLTNSKRQSLLRAIRQYLAIHKTNEAEINIKIMAIIVFLNTQTQQAKIKLYEDFVL